MTEQQIIEALKRANEYREIAEEYCSDGGFLIATERDIC